jgi:predicted AAA+ superfamily ATPase
MEFTRDIVGKLKQRILNEPKFIQIVLGPRQVGKTTAVRQLQNLAKIPTIYSAADSAGIADENWIRSKWREALALITDSNSVLLILDEVQLVNEWQQTVKGLWDEDRYKKRNLHLIVTGSSALMLKKGSESLAGRFEKHELLQWSFPEMKEAFGYSLEDFVLRGGYPGTAVIKDEEARWKDYIRSSLIETVLTKDILSLSNITKPSLLRQLFSIACSHPAQIVAYTNFLGQLADAGNTTTLSDYRLLLEDAYLLKTLGKWSGSVVRSRASKPKWIISDNSLVTALSNLSLIEIYRSPLYGRLVENAVINHINKISSPVYYWREKDMEVDAVIQNSGKLIAIEVKSGNRIRSRTGLNAFVKQFTKSSPLIIGTGGISVEEVLSAREWRW